MRIEKDQAAVSITSNLGLSPDQFGITNDGFIAAALRRSAVIHPGLSRSLLISEVVEPLMPWLVDEYQSNKNPRAAFRNFVATILMELTMIGDIIEVQEIDESSYLQEKTLYHPAPPSFIYRNNGDVILLGMTAGRTSPVPDYMLDKVEHRGLLRLIPASAGAEIQESLLEFGLRQFSSSTWTVSPPLETADRYKKRLDEELLGKNTEGNLKPTSILSGENVKYYSGRWQTVKNTDTGKFIGRIPQGYGSDHWAYLQIVNGEILRSRYFGTPGSAHRAWDEAWRLQSAIDVANGTPQQIDVECRSNAETAVRIHSPIPQWIERRWLLLGEQHKEKGSLSTYLFKPEDVEEEVAFAREMFWVEINQI